MPPHENAALVDRKPRAWLIRNAVAGTAFVLGLVAATAAPQPALRRRQPVPAGPRPDGRQHRGHDRTVRDQRRSACRAGTASAAG